MSIITATATHTAAIGIKYLPFGANNTKVGHLYLSLATPLTWEQRLGLKSFVVYLTELTNGEETCHDMNWNFHRTISKTHIELILAILAMLDPSIGKNADWRIIYNEIMGF